MAAMHTSSADSASSCERVEKKALLFRGKRYPLEANVRVSRTRGTKPSISSRWRVVHDQKILAMPAIFILQMLGAGPACMA